MGRCQQSFAMHARNRIGHLEGTGNRNMNIKPDFDMVSDETDH